ncbi:Peroxisomal 2,4-dienoyl-CoA reductase SPS19 [Yarrowia sp. C11]|nr:Peroxisomal 2,4-dienoyl-CoA reductase SPS19 [Yarrowia sp. E02]KAG5373452.1 Peroxisomal 2,4-dienoyl-CoA reductase SPS19 [Yarrowia sp. C11]
MPNTLSPEWLKKSVFKPDIFKGKVVFVTGGAGTICRVQTEAMILLGADAAIIGRRPEVTEKAAKEMAELRPGAKVIGVGNTDVREVKSLVAAAERTVKELGRIDYLICGAAGNFLSDFNHLSSNAFKSVISIDLLGSYNTVKACFPELRKNKGSILFVSATLHYYGIPFQTHVSAAKAGIDALSNALAVELGPLGIRSNCIAPGAIAGTEGIDRLLPADMREKALSLIPAQRWGQTEDIANGTVYIFSEAASYVSGTTIVVDGAGWHTSNGAANNAVYPQMLIAQGNDTPKL